VILLLLLAVFALTGTFAAQNGGTEVFQLFGSTRVLPTWAPTVIGVGAGAALVTLVVCASRLRSRLRAIRHDRLVQRHLGLIDRLEAANALLREQLAAVRSAEPPCDAGGRQGWPPPLTQPDPRSVTSSPPIARPPA
jgi:hypothetical protein